MSLYVDSSALLKLYFVEPDSDDCERILNSDVDWISGRHTNIEVRRNLVRELAGKELRQAQAQFRQDWDSISVVELDRATCEQAATFAETLKVRTLDSLHLATAHRVGQGALPFVTYDLRQAQAARSLGWTVLGT